MKHHIAKLLSLGAALVALITVAACGGRETTASKSAAAYREAQAKGIPVTGGHDHDHGHDVGSGAPAASPAQSGTAVDHAAMGHGTVDHSTMDHSTMDHSAMGHSAMGHTAPGAVDHAAMGHGTAGGAATATGAHAAHGTSAQQHTAHTADAHAQHRPTAAPGRDDHAGHQAQTPTQTTRAGADPHAGHTAGAQQQTARQHDAAHGTQPETAHAQHGTQPAATAHAGHDMPEPAAVTLDPPNSNAEIRRVDPTAVLRQDSFDAPVPVSVAEAEKAASGEAHGGHDAHQHPQEERR